MDYALIAKFGAGMVIAAGAIYAMIKLLALAARLADAEVAASKAGQANKLLADAVNKQQEALERNRKYARLLENQIIESAGPAELAGVLNQLFKSEPPAGGDGSK